MKKILVVLLVLAMAGGVFAQQGSWNLSGGAEIGTKVDFDPRPNTNDAGAQATVGGNGDLNGTMGLAYSLGGITAGIDLNTAGLAGFYTSFAGKNNLGNDYAFRAAVDGLMELADLDRDFSDLMGIGSGTASLWGKYSMLSNIIGLEAAYKSADSEFWASNKAAIYNNSLGNLIRSPASLGTFSTPAILMPVLTVTTIFWA